MAKTHFVEGAPKILRSSVTMRSRKAEVKAPKYAMTDAQRSMSPVRSP